MHFSPKHSLYRGKHFKTHENSHIHNKASKRSISHNHTKSRTGRRQTNIKKNIMTDAPKNDEFLRDAMIGGFMTFDIFY